MGRTNRCCKNQLTFGFAISIFQAPERYAYLSGTGKLRSIDRNLIKSGTRTCLVQMIKWKLKFRKFVSWGKFSNFNGSGLITVFFKDSGIFHFFAVLGPIVSHWDLELKVCHETTDFQSEGTRTSTIATGSVLKTKGGVTTVITQVYFPAIWASGCWPLGLAMVDSP